MLFFLEQLGLLALLLFKKLLLLDFLLFQLELQFSLVLRLLTLLLVERLATEHEALLHFL